MHTQVHGWSLGPNTRRMASAFLLGFQWNQVLPIQKNTSKYILYINDHCDNNKLFQWSSTVLNRDAQSISCFVNFSEYQYLLPVSEGYVNNKITVGNNMNNIYDNFPIPKGATILVTNRWNRSHLSWIFSKFLTFTLHTFVLTQMCRSPSPMLSRAYFGALKWLQTQINIGEGKITQVFQDLWRGLSLCQ